MEGGGGGRNTPVPGTRGCEAACISGAATGAGVTTGGAGTKIGCATSGKVVTNP
jgi:hypothetical protein